MIGISLGNLVQGFVIVALIVGAGLWLVLMIVSLFVSKEGKERTTHQEYVNMQEDQVIEALPVDSRGRKFAFLFLLSLLFLPTGFLLYGILSLIFPVSGILFTISFIITFIAMGILLLWGRINNWR